MKPIPQKRAIKPLDGPDDSKANGARERRLRFVEAMLLWTGTVRNGDVRAEFRVSPQQAATDLRDYAKSGNAVMHSSKHRWEKSPEFARLFDDTIEATLRCFPSMRERMGIEDLPSILLATDEEKLGVLIVARQTTKPVRIYYQTMSAPEPEWRVVCPHAIVNTHGSTYVRAFCNGRRAFRDFIVSRMIEVGLASADNAWHGDKDDLSWHRMVTVHIAPHPDLTISQAKLAMEGAKLPERGGKFRYRQAQVVYMLDNLGLLRSVQEGHGIPDASCTLRCLNAQELLPLVPKKSADAQGSLQVAPTDYMIPNSTTA